jgi:lipopolysaccharide/colanic/teichoic acid biosynthesis glycosyltransferase
MLLQRLILRWRRADDPAERTILDGNQLRRLLARERARTDRTGRPFSLLTLTPRAPDGQGRSHRRVLRILKRRLRITDEIGMLDADRLAVVLPETDARGAWKVLNDVLAAHPKPALPPFCEVYTYPSDWSGLHGETSAEGWEPDASRPAQPMELLFLRRMPLWKRGLDVLGASVGLVVSFPVLAIAALAIRLTSPGPALFRQWRSGAGGRPFVMYKLRTMAMDAESRKRELLLLNEQDGPAFKIKQDPRVTPVGRFLRKTSIDELPQLWNVLKGDMSLVGPRPLPCDESAGCEPWQQRRLDVKPGLTCIWQVSGRSRVTFDEWVRMDLRYIRSRSLWFDCLLLLATVRAILTRKGAS